MRIPPKLILTSLITHLWAMIAIGDDSEFKSNVLPILEQKCFGCHGPEKQKGKIRLDTLPSDLTADARAAETWHDALEVLNLGEMPPDDEPQLNSDERKVLVGWLTAEVERAAKSQKLAGSAGVIRRLNRVEYQNTMRDLIGIDIDYSEDLPPDALSEDGFQNNGAALQISDLELEYFLATARDALRRAIVTSPEPKVVSYKAEKSDSDKSRKGLTSKLGRAGVFIAKSKEFPDEGEFIVRVNAKAEMKRDAPYPRLQVEIGFRADTQTPSRVMGYIDITDTEPGAYELKGRIEEFPLQSRTQSKYPGLLVVVSNVYDDGKPAPKPKTIEVVDEKGKKRKKEVFPDDPNFPTAVIESVEFIGPIFDSWPPEHHRSILFDPEGVEKFGEREYAQEVLGRFMRRAFRRPVGDEETELFLQLFDKVRPEIGSFEEAIRETLSMVLISPDFLYLVEPAGDKRRSLDDHELASRLSYFLWSSMPDEELFRLADEGKLGDAKILNQQVERMLDSPKSWAFVEQFSGQWLDLGGIDRVAINPEYYPDFDNAIKPDLRLESQHFFAEILHGNSSALQFLDSDFTMLNEPLSRYYGIGGPRGSKFEKVSLKPGDNRGGLLGHAGILLANSTGEDSHPIKRGVWIRERLLHDPPASPPANVPNLDDTNPDFAKLPLKEQLKIHLEDAACADCHASIDPWGVAMEDFDAIGFPREEILRKDPKSKNKFIKHPVDSATTLPGGGEVDGLASLKAYLLNTKREQFAHALTEKMMAYALGRSVGLADKEEVENLTKAFVDDGYRLRGLIGKIVLSEAFHSK